MHSLTHSSTMSVDLCSIAEMLWQCIMSNSSTYLFTIQPDSEC